MTVPPGCAGMGAEVCQKFPLAGSMLMMLGSDALLMPHASDTALRARALSIAAHWIMTASVSSGVAGMVEKLDSSGPPGPPPPIGVPVTATLSIEALGRAPEDPAGPVPLESEKRTRAVAELGSAVGRCA